MAETAQNGNGRRALLIDWGGVLTTNLFMSFHEYCLANEIDSEQLVASFRSNPDFRELSDLAGEGADLRARVRAPLRRDPRRGLRRADRRAVRRACSPTWRWCRRSGPPTTLASDRAGLQLLGRAPLPARPLLGDLRRHRHLRRDRHAQAVQAHVRTGGRARRRGSSSECVFVDDLPFNLTPAAGAGDGHRAPHERRDHDPAA